MTESSVGAAVPVSLSAHGGPGGRAPGWLLGLAMGVTVLAASSLLAGCAGGPGVKATPSGEPITESDEPDTRKRARIRTTLAASYFEHGQDTVALDEIKQALAADPNYGPAYVLRGLVYMRMNDHQLTEESFRRALQINPNDSDAMHNYGWYLCGLKREKEAVEYFNRAIANPTYNSQAKTLMAKGVCEMRAGLEKDAEASFARSYQLDATNPVAGYNLAALLYKRGEFERAQFYVRRLNATELANAETLWLGIKIERQLKNQAVADQLAQQLQRRFPDSRELQAYRRGAFYE
ncbi:MAG: type IV pilus biogenesis/stability protein PilW [Burkholderiaceae bacterium]